MEKLERYIEDIIQEVNGLIKSIKTKREAKSIKQTNITVSGMGNSFVGGDIAGRDLIKIEPPKSKLSSMLDEMIADARINNSRVSIQAGDQVNINGQTIRTNGGRVEIVGGNVFIDGKKVRSGDSKETINLTVVVEAGATVKSFSIDGNVTMKNDAAVIDNLMAQGNITFNGVRDIVAFQAIRADGNVTINGNLEAASVQAGGNIVSSGKISWV